MIVLRREIARQAARKVRIKREKAEGVVHNTFSGRVGGDKFQATPTLGPNLNFVRADQRAADGGETGAQERVSKPVVLQRGRAPSKGAPSRTRLQQGWALRTEPQTDVWGSVKTRSSFWVRRQAPSSHSGGRRLCGPRVFARIGASCAKNWSSTQARLIRRPTGISI